MARIWPPVVPISRSNAGRNAAERAVLRIAGPFNTGKTIYKHNGTWRCGQHVDNATLLASDQVFTGGHVYDVDDDLLAEMLAGLSDVCAPTFTRDELYPSSDTYPSDGTFMGSQ